MSLPGPELSTYIMHKPQNSAVAPSLGTGFKRSGTQLVAAPVMEPIQEKRLSPSGNAETESSEPICARESSANKRMQTDASRSYHVDRCK